LINALLDIARRRALLLWTLSLVLTALSTGQAERAYTLWALGQFITLGLTIAFKYGSVHIDNYFE